MPEGERETRIREQNTGPHIVPKIDARRRFTYVEDPQN